MNKTTQTSRATSNTPYSKFNANIPQWSEASMSEEEYIGMCNCRKQVNAEIKNEKLQGKNSEAEDIRILKCSRKSHVDIIN